MLHLIGKPYILQHCLNALRQEQLEISYRVYMTDAVAGAEERWIDRMSDLVNDRPQAPQQSANEVIARIKNGLNGGDES